MVNGESSEANVRMIYTSQVLGFRHEGLKKVHALMDFPPPMSYRRYQKVVNKLLAATKEESENNMLAATKQEVEIEASSDICVSGDGSWQKRGWEDLDRRRGCLNGITFVR